MGGKTYYMLVIQGGSVSRIPPHETQKLQALSDTFFNAHQSADPETLRDKEITYIDSKGLHFSDGTTQTNTSVSPTEPQKETLFQGFDREKPQILQDFNRHYGENTPIQSIQPQYRPFLERNSTGNYSEAQIKKAIASYAFYPLGTIATTVVKSNPRSQATISLLFSENQNLSPSLEANLDAISNGLKVHVTAQTIWETMTNILQSQERIFVADPEDFDERELLLIQAPDDSEPYSHPLPFEDADEYSSEEEESDYDSFSNFSEVYSIHEPEIHNPSSPHPSILPLTVRRNPRESQREELVRLLAILVQDIPIEKHLSFAEKKKAAQALQHQLASFLLIEKKDLPPVPGIESFNIDQQILLREIFECMPEEVMRGENTIDKLVHVKREIEKHAK